MVILESPHMQQITFLLTILCSSYQYQSPSVKNKNHDIYYTEPWCLYASISLGCGWSVPGSGGRSAGSLGWVGWSVGRLP